MSLKLIVYHKPVFSTNHSMNKNLKPCHPSALSIVYPHKNRGRKALYPCFPRRTKSVDDFSKYCYQHIEITITIGQPSKNVAYRYGAIKPVFNCNCSCNAQNTLQRNV